MGNIVSRRRNRQEWTPGKVKRGSKDRSESNASNFVKANVETTSATKIDALTAGANGETVANVESVASVESVTAEIRRSQQSELTGAKSDIESTPQAVDQHQPVGMESTPEVSDVRAEVPPELPKTDPPAAAPGSEAQKSIETGEAAVIKKSEPTSASLPEVRIDNVMRQDSLFDATRIIETVTAEGIKLAAGIIASNPVAPEAKQPESHPETAPTPEPTADPLPSLVPEAPLSETESEVPVTPAEPAPESALAGDQPIQEEVKPDEPVSEKEVVAKSAAEAAEDHSLLIESSASSAAAAAILSGKEQETAVDPSPSDGQAITPEEAACEKVPSEKSIAAAPAPEKAGKTAEIQAQERDDLIAAAATTAAANGLLLQKQESNESAAKPSIDVAAEKKEEDSVPTPADPVPTAEVASEAAAMESEVETVVPNGEVIGDSQEALHENNNAKCDPEEAAVPAPVEA